MGVIEPCKFCFGTGINQTDRGITTSCTCRFCSGTGIAKSSIEDAQSAEIEQLKVRVTELSNALLVEKANNARMREALEAWQKFEKYSDKENAYELLKTAEILTKQALKGEG